MKTRKKVFLVFTAIILMYISISAISCKANKNTILPPENNTWDINELLQVNSTEDNDTGMRQLLIFVFGGLIITVLVFGLIFFKKIKLRGFIKKLKNHETAPPNYGCYGPFSYHDLVHKIKEIHTEKMKNVENIMKHDKNLRRINKNEFYLNGIAFTMSYSFKIFLEYDCNRIIFYRYCSDSYMGDSSSKNENYSIMLYNNKLFIIHYSHTTW